MRAFPISEGSQIADARRDTAALARRIGFGEEDQGRVAIVVTELGTNLVKHAGAGELLVGTSETSRDACIEVLALDRGPGMRDVDACLVDGYSTAGSQGTGLGAIRRQATTFDAFSAVGGGTAVHARVCRAGVPYVAREDIAWGVAERPLHGEEVSGDAVAVRESATHFLVLVADGLGHGPFAAQASAEAVRLFRGAATTDADALVEILHQGLRPTRGAAIAIAAVERMNARVTCCGIGNIAATLAAPGSTRRMISNNGTAGHVAPRIRGFQYPVGADSLLVMHSDGVSGNWSLDKVPGLARHDPALVAAVLYRDFARGRDDAAVLVARIRT